MRRRSAAGACRSRESSGTANDAAMRVAGQRPGWHFDPRRHPRGVLAALPIEASDTHNAAVRSEEHTSELQSLMRISYAVFCLKKKKMHYNNKNASNHIMLLTTHRENT